MISDATYHTLLETLSTYKEQERPVKHLEQRTAVLMQHQRRLLSESYLLTRELQPISEPDSLLGAEFLLANFLNPFKSPVESMNLQAFHIRQSLFLLYFIDLIVHRGLWKLNKIHIPLIPPLPALIGIPPGIIRSAHDNTLAPLNRPYPDIPRALNGSKLVYTKQEHPEGATYTITAIPDDVPVWDGPQSP